MEGPLPHEPPREERGLGEKVIRGCRWLGRQSLLFLEVIGLRAPQPTISREAQLARFRQHHEAFRRLLAANDSFLRNLAELDAKLAGRSPSSTEDVSEGSRAMLDDIRTMIESLNAIGDDRHLALWQPFEAVKARLSTLVEPAPEVEPPLVIEMDDIGYRDVDRVGAKMANLGEIRNRVGLPTPDGFAVTVRAYAHLLDVNGLERFAGSGGAAPSSRHDADRASAEFVDSIGKATVPVEITHAIDGAYARLSARENGERPIAVRSSALGEDELMSFAGQHETVLNVDRRGLVDAWRKVIASLHSRAAVQYRRLQDLPVLQGAMPVGFVTMVPAAAGGMVFSRHPTHADLGQVIIQVTPGLGAQIADGSAIPQTIEVTLEEGREVRATINREGAVSELPPRAGYPDEVTEDLDMALADQRTLLTDAEAVQLARWARRLESHFGEPQDIEWAMDHVRRMFVLQSRPLELASTISESRPPVAGAALLVSSGEIVCPGVATGVAVHLDDDGDFDAFPDRGVLVVKRPSPRFVRVMDRAAAIIADTGSTTGHMASLAREFRIPTLLGTREGSKAIAEGQQVTVDAFGGYVYAGAVDVYGGPTSPAPMRASGQPASEPAARRPGDIRIRWLLRRVAEAVVPLNLTDPDAAEFRAENCRTLHDLTRYVHERSYQEMFRLGESLDDCRSAAYFLDVFLPVDLYVIDLGGGIADGVTGNRIKLAHVTSTPMAALLHGMLHPKIPRWGARPIDLGGFASVVVNHALTSPEQERTFRDPSYALISDRYVNYTARVGYHFSIVDAYCGETTNKNYVHLLFRGGAADLARRSRRARAIAIILKAWGFSVDVTGDSTQGRITKMPREETARVIEHIGRLLQFMRQMDVAMTSEAAVTDIADAFLREDYALENVGGRRHRAT
jgi:pyruvate, water dikinase